MKKNLLSNIAAIAAIAASAAYSGETDSIPAQETHTMKTLVVYYSVTGNTETVARTIAEKYQADCVRIEEQKPRKAGAFLYISGGFAARRGAQSDIRPLAVNPQEYDLIFIGSPVWAGRPAPAVNTFASTAGLSGKNIVLFFTMGGNGCQSAADWLAVKIREKSGKPAGSFGISSGKTTPEEMRAKTRAALDKIPM